MKKIVEKWCSTSLILKIFIGLVLGAAFGIAFPQLTVLAIMGSVFVGALKSIAPVLVFLLVCSALSRAHSNIRKAEICICSNVSNNFFMFLLGSAASRRLF